jgi:hypothetical protein
MYGRNLRTPASENHFDTIPREYRIGGDYWHVVHLGGSDNHPVTWIGVNRRQFGRTDTDF